MSQFNTLTASSDADFLSAFGEKVFVNGLEIVGIFEDEETEAETGYRIPATLTVQRKELNWIEEGQAVVIIHSLEGSKDYRIKRIPDITDSLIPLELHRA